MCFPALGFLELINNMLTSGMVPALYADDEKEQIIGQVRRQHLLYFSSLVLLHVLDLLYSQLDRL